MLPQFTMRQLLEAGVHFGHQTHRWNPKMTNYLFGTRNKIHIIDLAKTVPLLHSALVVVSDVVARGGRVLFVATKRQALGRHRRRGASAAAQYFVNHRWLGGMLTNWKTITNSIKRLRQLDETCSRATPRPHQEGSAATHPRARQARSWRSAASATWAACPT